MPVSLPGSAFVYVITFIISGLVNEIWGKETAKECVKFGLLSQVVALFLFWSTGLLPAQNQYFQLSYDAVLGRNFVFVLADIVAGFTAQFANVFLFPRLKKWKHSSSCHRNSGLLNCISILITQLFDTAIFLSCAFGVGLGFFFHEETRVTLLTMFLGQYAIKIVVCFATIPMFNYVSKNVKEI